MVPAETGGGGALAVVVGGGGAIDGLADSVLSPAPPSLEIDDESCFSCSASSFFFFSLSKSSLLLTRGIADELSVEIF